MDRRALMVALGSAFLASAGAAGGDDALAAEADDQEHDQGGHPRQRLIQLTSHSVAAGEVCADLCRQLLATGDTTLAECLKSVSAVVAVCTAMRTLAASQSPATPALAKVTAQVCDDCEKECRRFEKLHDACRRCAESCGACARECRALSV